MWELATFSLFFGKSRFRPIQFYNIAIVITLHKSWHLAARWYNVQLLPTHSVQRCQIFFWIMMPKNIAFDLKKSSTPLNPILKKNSATEILRSSNCSKLKRIPCLLFGQHNFLQLLFLVHIVHTDPSVQIEFKNSTYLAISSQNYLAGISKVIFGDGGSDWCRK